MKPEADQLLRVLAGTLLTDLAPGLSEDYEKRSAMVASMLLVAVAEEWDRSASRRAEENAALREIFAEAVPQLADAELRARIEEAAGARPSGLRISELESENARLRGLLIDLHAHVETLDTPESRALENAIWLELCRSTERRALSIAPF
ncbi:MAG: hypothetical protein ABFS46_08675 [Myxococcota bacterium]